MKIRVLSLFALACLLSSQAHARPISYPGGWVLMGMTGQYADAFHADYTLSPKWSLGYSAENWREEDWQFSGLEVNYLLARWNAPDWQANITLKGAAGTAYSDANRFDHEWRVAGYGGAVLDWESRSLYTSYEAGYMNAGNIDRFFMHSARAGFAPYLGGYGDLHTWLMLQVDHNPTSDDKFTVTPYVRLFQGNMFGEAGISNHGHVLLHVMFQF